VSAAQLSRSLGLHERAADMLKTYGDGG